MAEIENRRSVSRDVAEIWPRIAEVESRGTAEMWPKHSRDVADRCRREIAEMQPNRRDAAELATLDSTSTKSASSSSSLLSAALHELSVSVKSAQRRPT